MSHRNRFKIFNRPRSDEHDRGLRSARTVVAASLVGSLALVGPAQAADEGYIVLVGDRPGCTNLKVSKTITVNDLDLKATTKGHYAAWGLYPADSRTRPGLNNSIGQVYNPNKAEPTDIASHTTYKRGNYKLCLLTDGNSTLSFAVEGLRGTLKPQLKPDQRLKPNFYSKILMGPTSSVEAAQGVHWDLTITKDSWQVADKELTMNNGTAASLGDRSLCIEAKNTDDTFCNQPRNPFNVHLGDGDSLVFTTPVNLPPGTAKAGAYEATYSGVDANDRLVFDYFQFTPVQS